MGILEKEGARGDAIGCGLHYRPKGDGFDFRWC